MHHFVECLISIAGASNPEVLDDFEKALDGPGVSVHGRQQTADQRWSFTVIGPGDGIRRSALRAFGRCHDLLGKHAAADEPHTLTILPLGETTMAECTELVHRISTEAAGKSVGKLVAEAQQPAVPVDADARERVKAAGFEARLSSAFPVPGGGSVAARTARLSTCLVLKVIAISLRSKKSEHPAGLRDELRAHKTAAGEIAKRFQQLEEDDQSAFLGLLETYRLPRADSASAQVRQDAILAAAHEAVRTPIDTLKTCLRLLEIVRALVDRACEGAVRAESDLGVAAELTVAAFRSSEWTVAVNLPALADDERSRVVTLRRELSASLEAAYQGIRAVLVKIIDDDSSASR